MRTVTVLRTLLVVATIGAVGAAIPTAEAARTSGVSLGFTAGTCVDRSAITGAMGTYTAQVERALGGSRSDLAAANVTLITEAAYATRFPTEIAAYEAACGSEPAEASCTGGVHPDGSVWASCSFAGGTCMVMYQTTHPVGFWGMCY